MYKTDHNARLKSDILVLNAKLRSALKEVVHHDCETCDC